uniref:Uncharacterized protein n=1 Tax=viral metagenome TaxID=1070528 RepID=A0A6C0BZF4_9ZZZZ
MNCIYIMKVKTLGKKAGKMVKSLLHNKYVLYLVSFLALTNIIGYLTIGDNRALGMFLALVLITSYFTKNLIIIFGVAMCGANVLLANNVVEGLKNRKKKKRIREGMDHKDDDSDSDDDDDDEPFGGGKKGRVDFDATRKAAYANLEKMLGPRGVSGLTKDAGKLMNQQEKMMKNLESFAPLLSKAEKMMGQFSNISGSLGNVDGLLEKLADGKQELEKKE